MQIFPFLLVFSIIHVFKIRKAIYPAVLTALAEMISRRGKQFDPKIVDLFEVIFD